MRGATRISNLAYDVARWTNRKVEAYRYDDIQERRANAIYETICAQHPHRRVSAKLQRRIETYAREVLGSPTVPLNRADWPPWMPPDFSHATLIGWDVALERSSDFSLMEWNTLHPGIVYSEANAGPLFTGLRWEELWKE